MLLRVAYYKILTLITITIFTAACDIDNKRDNKDIGPDNESVAIVDNESEAEVAKSANIVENYTKASTTKSRCAAPSEAWLELPAERTDGRYPHAAEYKIMANGERNYTHYYDAESYTSLWVAYPIEAKHMGTFKRPGSWSFNPLIDRDEQVNLCSRSYNDDYARGHLIPNASRNGNIEMQLQTFYVTNSVPQVQDGFNGGIWKNLESAIQDMAEQEIVYVVSGVAFAKEGEKRTIAYTKAKNDDKKVPIPNYFYKVVLKVDSDSHGNIVDASTIGFWFENRSYSGSYTNHTVTVDQVEAWTGFDYFANLPDDIEQRVERNASWSSFVEFYSK